MLLSGTTAVLVLASASLSVASPATPPRASVNDLQSRIKNVVVLVEENRSFDHFFGGFDYAPHIDGLRHRQFCNPVNASAPDSPLVCAQPTSEDVAPDDPNHGISGVNYEVYSTFHPDASSKPTMQGFVTEQATTFHTPNVTRAAEALNYYAPQHMRVLEAIARDYVLFDRWFAAVPGPTNPNRAYLTAGTSAGHGRNDKAFNVAALTNRSIFEALDERGVSWINYSNTTGFLPDALFYSWTVASGRKATNIKPLSQFFADARAGTLPQFTYLNPECCRFESFHPPSPVTIGESFVKNVYEALRSSPQWNSTLFILTFDEHGGFADHVAPPENVPAGDSLTYTEKAPDGKSMTFDFTRLGIRVPTLIASPWVRKGQIENKGHNHGGEYTHTSIIGFLNKLWDANLSTPRVEYSSTFEHLILEHPRAESDMVKTLPDAYPF